MRLAWILFLTACIGFGFTKNSFASEELFSPEFRRIEKIYRLPEHSATDTNAGPLQKASEKILRQALAGNAPWVEYEHSSPGQILHALVAGNTPNSSHKDDLLLNWKLWVRGASFVPLREGGKSPLSALYNPFAKEALFIRFDDQYSVQNYGYGYYGEYKPEHKKEFLNVTQLFENYAAFVKYWKEITSEKEEDVFKHHPNKITYLEFPALLSLLPFSPEAEEEMLSNPFVQKLRNGKATIKDIRPYASQEAQENILRIYDEGAIIWPQAYIVQFQSDLESGQNNLIFYDPLFKPGFLLQMIYNESDNALIKISAVCFKTCKKS